MKTLRLSYKVLIAVFIVFLLIVYAFSSTMTYNNESYMYCTNGSCYSLMDINFDGENDNSFLSYPPRRRPQLMVNDAPNRPFAPWQPSACAGLYVKTLDGTAQTLCGCAEQSP